MQRDNYYNKHGESEGNQQQQLELLQKQKFDISQQQREFWELQLADASLISLYSIAQEAESHSSIKKTETVAFNIRDQTTKDVAQLKKLFIGCVYSTLYRYTGENDLMIGIQDETTHAIPVRVVIPDCDKPLTSNDKRRIQQSMQYSIEDFSDHAARVFQQAKENILAPEKYRSCMPAHLRTALHTEFEAFDIRVTLRENGSLQTPNITPPGLLEFDIVIDENEIIGHINYDPHYFSADYITSMAKHFNQIVVTSFNNSACLTSDIPMLYDTEIAEINAFNNCRREPLYPQASVPEIFHQIAVKNRDSVAVVFHPSKIPPYPTTDQPIPEQIIGPEYWTYEHFDKYSAKIANFLLQKSGLKKGDHVGVSITRSLELPAIMFGVMKAGMVLVPLETTPSNLFRYKAKNSGISLYMVDDNTKNLFTNDEHIFNIRDFLALDISDEEPDIVIHPDDPAYMYYSSGSSSGEPKGIVNSHKGFSNLLNALLHALMQMDYPEFYKQFTDYLQKKNPALLKVICTAPHTFDAVLYDFLIAFITNGEVHLTSENERRSPDRISEIIRSELINFAAFLPGFMSQLPPNLRLAKTISMGQSVRNKTFEQWHAANPENKLINASGPTEVSVCSNMDAIYDPNTPIGCVGRPLSGNVQYVLTKDYAKCPPYVQGEIFHGGDGVAIGYYNKPELSAEKFIYLKEDPSGQKFIPCAPEEGVRFYASGDNGMYVHDSEGRLSMLMLGRKDRMIKINGVSISLDGLESSILSHPDVSDVAVVPVKLTKQSEPILFAFVVMKYPVIDEDETKIKLKNYMKSDDNPCPQPPIAYPRFQSVIAIPANTNGKIDYKRLEQLAINVLETDQENAPTNSDDIGELQEHLCKMWRKVIGIRSVGIHNTFDSLGGSSGDLETIKKTINFEYALPDIHAVSCGSGLSINMTVHDLAITLEERIRKCKESPERAGLKSSFKGGNLSGSMTMFSQSTSNGSKDFSQPSPYPP